jgi:hypothetical protein
VITGMLWFDNTKDELSKKIVRAVSYYTGKYGATPDTCFVNPKITDKELQVNGVSVRPDNYMFLNHYWLGIEEKESEKIQDGKLR